MEINGVPLHPLVVHAAVVFGPLAALSALGYAALPKWRDTLRWPMLVLVVIAGGALTVARFTGADLMESRGLEALAEVRNHQKWGNRLFPVSIAFTVIAVATGLLDHQPRSVKMILNTLLGVSALALLVLVVITGDAGARAVWG